MRSPKLEAIDLSAPPVGEWVIWDPAEAERSPDLLEAVRRFEGLDCETGEEAANFLIDRALDNDPSTKTWLLVVDDEIEGYFACCNGSVRLGRQQSRMLRTPHRRTLPAFIVAWIARRRGGAVGGEHLMLKAIGVAREQRRQVGSVVLALDPGSEEAARIWVEDYGFERCLPDEDDEAALARLFLRID